MDLYILYFDGCSKGNPGHSGAGAVLYKDKEEIWANSLYVGAKKTNNVAEYTGLLIGLRKAVEMGITCLLVRGDSQLVIRQMRGEYKVQSINILSLYKEAKTLSKMIENIQFEHVYRDKNTRADALSNEGINHCAMET